MERFLDQFFNLEIMARYLPDVAAGFLVTIQLALSVIVTGLLFGLALAVVRAFQVRPVNWLIILFVDLFRALPPLVILIIFYFGLPFIGITMSAFVISWIVLASVLAAFAEEIYWAGITSVNRGQWEASRSTGLGFTQTLFYVVIPQAIRMTIPPLTNRTIAITKNTALASVVTVEEMLTVAQTSLAYAANTSPLTMAAIGYLLIFFPLTMASRWVETRYAWKR
ncbi:MULTISPECIES: amino acid ABC transporter permease [Thalassobaculum]|uniref:Amino acid ABC transporter membrane protein 1, PAAT family (TC 3.A.1.3.-) n=1 Tax=Thalassobaculum litoreum DSM 18839 TaxID=1123362 RepID=A0A8G2EU35_9PROT|nr:MULTISPECIES: amino acid ABC transporter permease [Thalassobaculum]SDF13550.1 amino acid ABC transporter membrane protein 1, PAAT family (TC 3.A.1.3.-) [Thalassobaculum litoreum DSM 18839]